MNRIQIAKQRILKSELPTKVKARLMEDYAKFDAIADLICEYQIEIILIQDKSKKKEISL